MVTRHLTSGSAGGAKALPAGPAVSEGKPKPSWIRRGIALVIVLIGLALISYPLASNWLNQRAQNVVSDSQQQAIASSSPNALVEEKIAANSYNERLLNGSSRVSDPFDGQDFRPGNHEYERVLNIANDLVMGELVIPKIGVDLPIYHYTTDASLSHGIGHVVNTSVPFGGPSTHSVLAGHTGLPTARLFDRLNELSEGDWFVIRVLGEDHAYRVYSTEVVLPDKVESLSVEKDKDLVTLVTCTPYGVNSHRLLVHAHRTELPAEWTSSNDSAPSSSDLSQDVPGPLWQAALAGGAMALVILGAARILLRALKKLRCLNP